MNGTVRYVSQFWEWIILFIILVALSIVDIHLYNSKILQSPSGYLAEATIVVLSITLYYTFSYNGRITFDRPTHFAIVRRKRIVRLPEKHNKEVKAWDYDDEFVIPISIVNTGAISKSLYFALEICSIFKNKEDKDERKFQFYTFDFVIDNLPYSYLVREKEELDLDSVVKVQFSKPLNVKGRDAVVSECIFALSDWPDTMEDTFNGSTMIINVFYRLGHRHSFSEFKGWKPAFTLEKRLPGDLTQVLGKTHFWSVTAFQFDNSWEVRNKEPPKKILSEDESS